MTTRFKQQAEVSRLLRRKEVEARTGLSRSSIYARMDKGTFPSAIGLGGRAVAWLENEIDAWVQGVIEARSNRTTGGVK